MSNELTTAEPTDIFALEPADQIAALANQLKKSISVVPPMISATRNGKLRLPNDSQVDSLDVVLLGFVYRNQYYPKPFSEGQFNELHCSAVGQGSNDDLIPLASSKEKQHDSCRNCPKNQYGSHPSGSRGKACQNQVVLAVTEPDFDPDSGSGVIWTVKAQPTALKQIGSYILRMVDLHHHPVKVITRLSLDEKSQYPSLRTNFVGPNPLWESHLKLMPQAQKALYAGAEPSNHAVDDSTKLPDMLGG